MCGIPIELCAEDMGWFVTVSRYDSACQIGYTKICSRIKIYRSCQ